LLFPSCSSFRIIVLKDPLTPEEHLNLGVTYERNGEFDHAIREYKSASKKFPIAYLYLGNTHFQKNEYQKAEAYYKKAIKKEPQNADAYNNLAWLYFTQREKLDEGEKLALKAIELSPAKEHIYRDTLEKIRELMRLRE
jgi:tetratricopeptide (TPR) repeat protein